MWKTGCRNHAKVGEGMEIGELSRRGFAFSLLAAVGSGCRLFRSPEETLADVRLRYERELIDNVVPFWMRHSVDSEYGGFLTCLDREGKVYDTFKHLWMQWREVYMFAALWNAGYRDRRYLDIARHGFAFLQRHGRRPDGSYHYMLNRDGSVLCDEDCGQEVFTESFAAIGCAELYRATGDERYRQEALSAYRIYRRNTEKGSGQYDLLAYPMIELNVAQTLDAAFGGYGEEIDSCIRRIVRFAHPESGLMLERAPKAGGFDLDSQDGRFVNPGHALEGMSFIMRRLMASSSANRDGEILDFALRETRIMGEFGWDGKEGGIWYFQDALGKPMSRHEYFLKAWWPQTEAATAMLRAYALSRDEYFLEFFRKIDEFAWRRLKDWEKGEWFAYAPVGGRFHHPYKGSRFKGFFHLPRYLLDCIQTIRWIEST